MKIIHRKNRLQIKDFQKVLDRCGLKIVVSTKIPLVGKVMTNGPEVGYFAYSDNEDVISSEDAEPNSVMIFDGITCERQNKIKEYFTKCPQNLIDYFILGKLGKRILTLINVE